MRLPPRLLTRASDSRRPSALRQGRSPAVDQCGQCQGVRESNNVMAESCVDTPLVKTPSVTSPRPEQELDAQDAQKNTTQVNPSQPGPALSITPALPSVLLLSDSALPLGSFAYSSGLESFLAHRSPQRQQSSIPGSSASAFASFLVLSLASLAAAALPYVGASWRCPVQISRWDNDHDASTACPVARRASVAQGRALLQLWEHAFAPTAMTETAEARTAAAALAQLAAQLLDLPIASTTRERGCDPRHGQGHKLVHSYSMYAQKSFHAHAHFAVVWGCVCRAMSLEPAATAYMFMHNHAKALLSAAVRASVVGPTQSQAILASPWLQQQLHSAVHDHWQRPTHDAAQLGPMLDLWVGRHELLYSRIFNS